MSTTYMGINYWPLNVNFFECDAIELAEAQYGIKANGAISKLMCKIYKEGYFIPWGEEQSMIFARKLGGEVSAEEMNGIVGILLDKGFFDKTSYDKFRILTSEDIQQVWLEATYRRKRNLEELPHFLVDTTKRKEDGNTTGKNGKIDELNKEEAPRVNNLPVQVELNRENDSILEQSKAEQSKEENSKGGQERKNGEDVPILIDVPEYALNKVTHNYAGLIENLDRLKVTMPKDVKAIVQLSDYGRKETVIWKLFLNTNWGKITAPGKYIIKSLCSPKA